MKKFIAKLMTFIMIITAMPLSQFGGIHTVQASASLTALPGIALDRSSQAGDPNPVIPLNPAFEAGRALLQWPLDNVSNYTLTYALSPTHQVTLELIRVAPGGAVAYEVRYTVSPTPGLHDFQVWHVTTGGSGFVPIPAGATGPYDHFLPGNPNLTTPSLNHNPAAFTGPVFTITQGQGFTFRYAQREVSFFWSGGIFHYSIEDTRGTVGSAGIAGLERGVIHEFNLENTTTNAVSQRNILSELDIASIPTAVLSTAAPNRVDIVPIVDYVSDNPAENPGLRLTIAQPTFLRPDGSTPALSAGNFGDIRSNINLVDTVNSNNNIDIRLLNLFGTPTVSSPTPGVNASFHSAAGAWPIVIDVINAANSDHIKPSTMFTGSVSEVYSPATPRTLESMPAGRTPLRGIYTFIGWRFIEDANGTPLIEVTPFPGQRGSYGLFGHQSNPGGLSLVLTRDHVSTFGNFIFAVPEAAAGRRYYQVAFSSLDEFPTSPLNPAMANIIRSQIVWSPPMQHRIGAPIHFEIDRDNIELRSILPQIPPRAELNLPISWDIGRAASILDLIDNSPNGEYILWYELQWADAPSTDSADFVGLQRFRIAVSRSTAGGDTITVELSDLDNPGTGFLQNPPITFDLNPRLLPGTTLPHYVINWGFDVSADDFINLVNIPAFMREYPPATGANLMLYYPGVFFFRMTLIGRGADDTLPSFEELSRPSLLEDVTLSALDNAAVPPLQNLRAFNPVTTNEDATATPPTVDEVSFEAAWTINRNLLSEFVRLSSLIDFYFAGEGLPPLLPSDPEFPNLDIHMNVYISQNESRIIDFTTDVPLAQREAESMRFEFTPGTPAANFYNSELVFSAINGKTPMAPLTPPANSFADARDALRANEVVRITIPFAENDLLAMINNGSLMQPNLSFLFDGLDKNQTYFIAVDLVVRESNPNPIFAANPLGGDSITSVIAITTAGDPDVPHPGDMIPPAPIIVEPIEGSSTWAEVRWHRHNYNPLLEIFEYEIIRVRNEQIATPMTGEFAPIFNAIEPQNINPDLLNKIGWRTNLTMPPLPVNNSNRLLVFNESTSVFRALTGAEVDAEFWVYNDDDASYHILRDNSIRPNQIYFYYIRTRRTLRDENGDPVPSSTRYSNWERATITSTPVDAPQNLRLAFDEYGRLPNSRPYDRRHEVIIAFEAAVNLAAGDRLFFSFREGDGPWSDDIEFVTSRTPFVSQLIMPPPVNIDDAGFITFMYRITGLAPGRDYAFRVRAQDAAGALSLYTNILIYRTNMDQGDFDDENRLNDWNERLNNELDRLARQPNFVLTDNNSVFTTWYRPSMFDGLIRGTPDVTITLPSGTATTSIFYMPQSVIQAANRANKGFRVVRNNIEVMIPPRAVSTPDNDVVREMDRRVRERDIADYYVRIMITWNDALNAPAGINHTVNISFAGVGSIVNIAALEREMNSIMLGAIASAQENTNLQAQLRDMIRNRVSSEDMIKYIDSVVRDVKNGVAADLNRRMVNTRTAPVSLQTLDRAFFISVQNIAQGTAANGFFYESGAAGAAGWRPRETMTLGNGRGIQASATGLYGFDVRELLLPNIGTVQNAPTATGIVARYGLDIHLGEFNLDRNMSRDQVVNSVAAVMGMPRGGNGYDFLRNRGYNVSNRNGGGNISTQEAIHIVMMLYEVRANVRVSAIQIRNQAATANIAGIDNTFRPSIRAAFELGIFTDRNMRPNDPINLRDFLQMLTNMDARVRL